LDFQKRAYLIDIVAGARNHASRSKLKILGVRTASSKFRTEDPQILGAVVQNLVATAKWRRECVHRWIEADMASYWPQCCTLHFTQYVHFFPPRRLQWQLMNDGLEGIWKGGVRRLIKVPAVLHGADPSWEANRSSGNQEIPRVLWSPKVHYRL
jgi:hypothetical protein